MALTNFRAHDFKGGASASSEEPEQPEPEQAPEPEPEPEDEGGKPEKPEKPKKEDVPAGTINEIKAWVGDDKDKAEVALEVENEKENPRSTLVDWLEDVLQK